MTTESPEGAPRFREMSIDDRILSVLDAKNFTTPTPIQHQAIPPGLEGKDIVGIAQTGTGKTLAFAIPTLQALLRGTGRALILAPTRELAYQIEETFSLFRALGIGTAVFVGGASMKSQLEMLRKNPRILVATPGRLNDHLEQGTVTLREVRVLVLDEADRMLDMGFLPQINRILKHVPTERQTMLFSATMPKDIMELATRHMKLPLRIEVAPAGTTAERVEQELIVVEKNQKLDLLGKLLRENEGSVLVFSRTKHGAKKIVRVIRGMGHTSAELHGNRSLNQRLDALDGFKTGKYRVLVATDLAGRGIDVTGIDLVINYDLPDQAEDYVHRIGRTGRAGREGKAISFASPDQTREIRDIERLTRLQLPRKRHVAGDGRTTQPLPTQPAEPREPQRQQHRRSHDKRQPSPARQQSHPRRDTRPAKGPSRFRRQKPGFDASLSSIDLDSI